MSGNCDKYSVKGSSGVSAGMLRKLIFNIVFLFFGKSFFGRKVMLESRTSRSSVQNFSII